MSKVPLQARAVKTRLIASLLPRLYRGAAIDDQTDLRIATISLSGRGLSTCVYTVEIPFRGGFERSEGF